MKQSQLFSSTRREAPHEEESKNAILLARGGYVEKTAAGVFSYLPLGVRVIQKICAIVREEMNALPYTQEILMTALQPKELWEETNRWDDPGVREVMYRVDELAMGLAPTHEENAVDLFRKNISSHKQLPVAAYQIQTKFRKEARAKSGLLRGREFMMKDLYSFHVSEADLDEYYEQAAIAYQNVYTRCGLNAIRTEASGGIFSKIHSDEFQVINPVGEDTIYLNAEGTLAWNEEVVDGPNDPRLIEWGGGEVRPAKATEVGNIFRQGTRYTEPMNAQVNGENGERLPVFMGAYGIGISRLMGIVVELLGDLQGKIYWPTALAPFKVHLIDLGSEGKAAELYTELKKAGVEVLFDDREKSAGEKFADADLVGSPIRIVLSKRSLAAGGAEVTLNWSATSTSEVLPIEKVVALTVR